LLLALRVLDAVTDVEVLLLKEVHDRQDLAVVGHEGLTDGVTAGDEGLEDVQGGGDDVSITRVQGSLDRDNELGDDGENLGLAVLEQIEDTLTGEEAVGLLLLTDSLHEDGEVVMVVQLLHLNLPCDLVGRTVLNLDGKISAVVEAAELRGRDRAPLDGASSRSDRLRSLNRLVEGGDFATGAHALLEEVLSSVAGSNGNLCGSETFGFSNDTSIMGQVSLREVTENGL